MTEAILLSHDETLDMIARAQDGDEDACKNLVIRNSALIRCIVKRFLNRGVEFDDLYQIGSIGLLKAIKKYDFSYGVHFSTYAVPMISGEIKRYLRDEGSIKVSRSIKENAALIAGATERLRNELGREIRLDDVADKLGMSREDVVLATESSMPMVSLHKCVFEDDGGVTVADTIPDNTTETTINRLWLKEMICSLEAKERQIIYMHYFMDKTQSEIAKVLGVSQVQISRLESRIFEKIKKSVE